MRFDKTQVEKIRRVARATQAFAGILDVFTGEPESTVVLYAKLRGWTVEDLEEAAHDAFFLAGQIMVADEIY